MIQAFVDRFMAQTDEIKRQLAEHEPEDYDDLVKLLVTVLRGIDGDDIPDPSRITVIDYGGMNGTRLFIIASSEWHTSTFWSIFVDYGSCCGCDTFAYARDMRVGEARITDYWTLMLHMVQKMRLIGEPE